MSDLVGNPEDRFSHNEAHKSSHAEDCDVTLFLENIILKLNCCNAMFRGVFIKESYTFHFILENIFEYTE